MCGANGKRRQYAALSLVFLLKMDQLESPPTTMPQERISCNVLLDEIRRNQGEGRDEKALLYAENNAAKRDVTGTTVEIHCSAEHSGVERDQGHTRNTSSGRKNGKTVPRCPFGEG